MSENEGQLLVIYHAEPGTSSAEKLGLLASLARPAATGTRDALPLRAYALRLRHQPRRLLTGSLVIFRTGGTSGDEQPG